MTKDKLMLTSAAELSEAVAVHVMGWKHDGYLYWKGKEMMSADEFWDITDPRHWMMVVEAMQEGEFPYPFKLQAPAGTKKYSANFENSIYRQEYDDNPGIAIGLAALRAKGIHYDWEVELKD